MTHGHAGQAQKEALKRTYPLNLPVVHDVGRVEKPPDPAEVKKRLAGVFHIQPEQLTKAEDMFPDPLDYTQFLLHYAKTQSFKRAVELMNKSKSG